jgi:hypothetical protein
MKVAGVLYQINWRQFKKGHSFFIPCLHCPSATEEIKRVTNRLKYKVVTKCVIENSIRGVRIWRI